MSNIQDIFQSNSKNVSLQEAFSMLQSGGTTPEAPEIPEELKTRETDSVAGILGKMWVEKQKERLNWLTSPFEPMTLQDAYDIAMNFSTGGMTRALHGSPYKGIKKFDISKIGSGEGSAARGWGFYFSDLEDVVKTYKDIAPAKKIYSLSERNSLINKLEKEIKLDKQNFRIPEEDFKDYSSQIRDFKETGNPRDIEYVARLFDVPMTEGGQIYKVKLNPNKLEDNWLDWDKIPEKQQIDKILNQAEKENKQLYNNLQSYQNISEGEFLNNNPGSYIYDTLTEFLGSTKAASQFLDRAGIDGIRFPAGSIMGKGWQVVKKSGTDKAYVHEKATDKVIKKFDSVEEARAFLKENEPKNYVVFNPDKIEIVE